MESLEDRLEQRRKKNALRHFLMFLIVMGILGIVSSFILIILSIILMLAGLSSMYELGIVMNAIWGQTSKEKKTLQEKAVFDQNFYEGLLLSGGGLLLLMFTFYLMSMGWYGLIHIQI